MKTGPRRRARALAGLLAISLVAVACGSDDEGGDATSPAATAGDGTVAPAPTEATTADATVPATEAPTPTDAAAPATDGSADVVADAQTKLEEFSLANVSMPKPADPVDPGDHRVAIVSCGQAGIGCQIMVQGLFDAVEAAGWTASPLLDGEFDPAKQALLINQAVQEGYEAIFLAAIDTASVKAAVDTAIAAGIAVFCNTCQSDAHAGQVIDVGANGTREGAALAYWSIVQTEGKGKLLAIDDKAFSVVGNRVKSYQDTIAANCPDCQLDTVEMATTELAEAGPPTFRSELSARQPGDLDIAIPPYDAAVIPMAATITQSGRGDVMTAGYEALPPTQEEMQKADSPIVVSTVLPYYFSSWLMVDLAARGFAGQDLYEANDLAVSLVSGDEVTELADETVQVGYDFKTYFTQLWSAS